MRILKALLIWGIITGVSAYAQAPPAAKVVVSKINFQTKAQNRSFIGTFYYERISNISSEFSGLVEKVDASTGDKIKKGDPLVYLDTEILEKEISILENTLAQAALSIEHSKKNYQRMDALVKKGGISEKDFDDANYVYQDALLKQQSTRIMLEKLLIQKRKSIIYAPFDGIVLEKNIDSGDWVQQGKSLMSIGSVKDLFIKVPVAETLLQFIRINQSVPVTINADNREIKGTIENFSPIADANTKNVFLKIRIPLLTRASIL